MTEPKLNDDRRKGYVRRKWDEKGSLFIILIVVMFTFWVGGEYTDFKATHRLQIVLDKAEKENIRLMDRLRIRTDENLELSRLLATCGVKATDKADLVLDKADTLLKDKEK